MSASGEVASGDPPEIGGSISSGASAAAEWCGSVVAWASLMADLSAAASSIAVGAAS